jgi:hypothetical protein
LDAEFVSVTTSRTEEGPASQWSAWEAWTLPWKPKLWVSHRTRRMVEHVETMRVMQRCRRKCPMGYRPYGDPPTGCEWVLGDTSHARWTLPFHATWTEQTYEEQRYEWVRTEWRTRTTNPYTTFVTLWRELLAAGLVGVGSSSGAEPIQVQAVPAVCLGDRLVLGADDEAPYEVWVDGRAQSPEEDVVAADLGVGFHTLELAGDDPEFGQLRLQVPVSVVHPLEFAPTPITTVELNDDTNGSQVSLLLRNRSRSDYAVNVRATGVPAGWMTLCLGEPVVVLPAGGSHDVMIQVERMMPWRSEVAPLPFTINASPMGSGLPDASTTFLLDIVDRASHAAGEEVPLEVPVEAIL